MLTVFDVKGVGPTTGTGLSEKGITTAEQLAQAEVADLLSVPGIGEARAKVLIAAAKASLVQTPVSDFASAHVKAPVPNTAAPTPAAAVAVIKGTTAKADTAAKPAKAKAKKVKKIKKAEKAEKAEKPKKDKKDKKKDKKKDAKPAKAKKPEKSKKADKPKKDKKAKKDAKAKKDGKSKKKNKDNKKK